jgi:hypothetical protein
VTKIEITYQEEVTGNDRQISNIVEVGTADPRSLGGGRHGKFKKYVVEKLSFGIDKGPPGAPSLQIRQTGGILPSYASLLGRRRP